MKILSIETSCDETAVALIDARLNADGFAFDILGDALFSQIEIHKEYGGVYPMLAKRAHAKNLVPVLCEALEKSGLLLPEEQKISKETKSKIEKILEREEELADGVLRFISQYSRPEVDVIAVTYGPGLEPALWVGIGFARALALAWNLPIMPVNHMEGHIYSAFFGNNPELPSIALLVSGGHTELVLMEKPGEYKLLGETRDDAAGEAFDKIARILGLPYPGGPEISRLAAEARERGLSSGKWSKLPRPMMHSDNLDFSFSGLKTAVLYATRGKELTDKDKMEIAREAEDAIVEVLVAKTLKALESNPVQSVILAGGVASNGRLRLTLREALKETATGLFTPSEGLYTDNASMIGAAAGARALLGDKGIGADDELRSSGRLSLGS